MYFSFEFDFFGNPLLASSLTDYFFQSNFAGQVIVVVLLGFSLLAWGAMFCKNADLLEMKKQNATATRAASRADSIAEAAAIRNLSGPYAILMRDAIAALDKSGAAGAASSDDKNSAMTFVDNALQRSLSRQIIKYESRMILLGTVISGAPFLGLLGTAWGVMDCFGSMSGQTSVTLQQLAPGVAGALLTTVAGLCVAIPAVFGYNYLTSKSRELITETENFASLISDRIEMETRTSHAYRQVAAAPKNMQSPQYEQPQYEQPQYAQPAQQNITPATATPVDFKRPAAQVPKSSIIDFSLDDNIDSPTPPRDFDD